jgi:Spy/CpxP family protein refolding chaperone
MKNTVMRFVLVLSLLLNVSMLISAGYTYYRQSQRQTPLCSSGVRKTGLTGPGCLFEKLSLRGEQHTTMQQMAVAFHADLDTKRQEIERKRISLVTLMREESPDKKAIDATISEIAALQQAVQRMAATHMLEFKGMLDKDQQAKFFDLIEGTMRQGAGLQCP